MFTKIVIPFIGLVLGVSIGIAVSMKNQTAFGAFAPVIGIIMGPLILSELFRIGGVKNLFKASKLLLFFVLFYILLVVIRTLTR